MAAICIPRQIPKKGILRVRANSIAWTLPSVPRSPKPPGTRMPSTSSRCPSMPSCSIFSESIYLRYTRQSFEMPPWVKASAS